MELYGKKVRQPQHDGAAYYPATITEAVVDKRRGKTLDEELVSVTGSYGMGNSRTATDLLPVGNATHVEFLQRDSKQEGVVNITKLVGKTLAWNQVCPKMSADWYAYNGTLIVNENFATYTASTGSTSMALSYSRAVFNIGHKYFMSIDLRYNSHLPSVNIAFGKGGYYNIDASPSEFAVGQWKTVSGIIVAGADGPNDIGLYLRASNAGDTINIGLQPLLVDLTQMYGSGNEPTSVEQFYNDVNVVDLSQESGKLISFEPKEIVSTNADNSKSVSLDLSGLVLRSAGNVADTYENGKIIRRVGVKVFDGSENWSETENNTFFTFDIANVTENLACNFYSVVRQTGLIPDKSVNTFYVYYTSSVSLWFRDTSYASVDAWKSRLADLKAQGNPLTVYYELATPIVEDANYNLSYHTYENGHEVVDSPVKMIAEVKEAENVYSIIAKLQQRIATLEGK